MFLRRLISATRHIKNRYRPTRNLLLACSLPACLCLITMVNAAFRHKTPLPEFEILVSAKTLTGRANMPTVRTYRIVHVILDNEKCIVITDDGKRLTVLGTAATRMKPGFVFQARTTPQASWSTPHQKQHAMWLIEPPS